MGWLKNGFTTVLLEHKIGRVDFPRVILLKCVFFLLLYGQTCDEEINIAFVILICMCVGMFFWPLQSLK